MSCYADKELVQTLYTKLTAITTLEDAVREFLQVAFDAGDELCTLGELLQDANAENARLRAKLEKLGADPDEE